MTNFQSVWAILNHDVIPIFCDKCVFHLVVNIILNKFDFFKEPLSTLAKLHSTKVLLQYTGRSLTGSGASDVLFKEEVL